METILATQGLQVIEADKLPVISNNAAKPAKLKTTNVRLRFFMTRLLSVMPFLLHQYDADYFSAIAIVPFQSSGGGLERYWAHS